MVVVGFIGIENWEAPNEPVGIAFLASAGDCVEGIKIVLIRKLLYPRSAYLTLYPPFSHEKVATVRISDDLHTYYSC